MQTTVAPPQAPAHAMTMIAQTPASRGSRLLAVIVDTAAFLALYLVALVFNEPMIAVVGLMALVACQIYFLSSLGQSIGKKVMGIRIVKNTTGENGGFGTNVLVRLIANGILGFVPLYSLVDVLFIFRQDRRCLHDLIAGTKVVEV